jgi:hypothetical protein
MLTLALLIGLAMPPATLPVLPEPDEVVNIAGGTGSSVPPPRRRR